MQYQERDVLRWATLLGGVLMIVCTGIALLDPTRNLPAIDAQYVRAALTSVATFGFGALTWGLLHRDGLTGSSRLRAWRRRTRGEED